MKNNRKIFVILIVIVLLPALFYSAYQISTLNETEELLQQVYTRQLDAILFSVNQYILDNASGWANQIENNLSTGKFNRLLENNKAILSITVADSELSTARVFPAGGDNGLPALKEQREKIQRLLRYRSVEYRKLETVVYNDTSFMILFVTAQAPPRAIGIIVGNSQFINDIVSHKLNEIAQNEFLFAIVKNSTRSVLYATSDFPISSIVATKQFWIFPDYYLGIRTSGQTLAEVMHERYVRNLALILFSDIILLAGVWFVYRTIKREMELVALRSDFVSNVSHELRTPLSLIRMFSETLEMKRVKTEKQRQEYYRIILHETERLTRLINNILNFSRMESNTRKYSFRSTDINSVVSSVLDIYSYQLENLHFSVKTLLGKDIPSVAADEEAIAEALHNLIDNAIKYSADEKFISISTAVTGRSVQMSIEDHGIGIPVEKRDKIFEKFYRVSQGLVHTAKGSGLGLAIVQHIVLSHGGTITVGGEFGKGTIFTITLPIEKKS